MSAGIDVLTRRGFLGLMAAVAASGVIVPALQLPRKPYITAEDGTVSYIGAVPGGFTGSLVVHRIRDWDGHGYPVELWNGLGGSHRGIERYYDFDLVNFNRELPPRFWSTHSMKEVPNVHTWLRTQRFGETVAQAMDHLKFVGVRLPA